jgi:hypothetical protein
VADDLSVVTSTFGMRAQACCEQQRDNGWASDDENSLSPALARVPTSHDASYLRREEGDKRDRGSRKRGKERLEWDL